MKAKRNPIKDRFEKSLKPTLIKKLRAQKGVSQADMSSSIGVSRQTYGKIETAVRLVKKERADLISRELKKPVSKLFRRQNNKYLALTI